MYIEVGIISKSDLKVHAWNIYGGKLWLHEKKIAKPWLYLLIGWWDLRVGCYTSDICYSNLFFAINIFGQL